MALNGWYLSAVIPSLRSQRQWTASTRPDLYPYSSKHSSRYWTIPSTLLCPIPQEDSFAVCSLAPVECLLLKLRRGWIQTVTHMYAQIWTSMPISTFLDRDKNWAILLHWRNAGCSVCPKASGQLELTKKTLSLSGCYIGGCCGYVSLHCSPIHCLDIIRGSCTVSNLPHPCTNPQYFLFHFKNMFSIQMYPFFFYQISFFLK